MGKTKIEWVEYSINPIRAGKGKSWPSGTHCTKISPGCAHCYAEPLNKRFGNGLPYDNTPTEFHLDLSVFDSLPKTKPCRVFVQSMGDLFHEDVPFEMVEKCFDEIRQCIRHTYLILTKRPERVIDYWEWRKYKYLTGNQQSIWPANLWLGVTAENQEQADKRIPILLQIPAAKRFVSFEPLLGDIEIEKYLCEVWRHGNLTCKFGEVSKGTYFDWVIVGAESGHKRRECKIDWIRNIVEQCEDSDVPCFVKQIHLPKYKTKNIQGVLTDFPDGFRLSKNIDEWPPSLQVQEYPV